MTTNESGPHDLDLAVAKPRRSRSRWAVPAVAVVAVAATVVGVNSGSQIAAAVTGSLPTRTPAQLLSAVASAKAQPLSGTVVESADFGLPALPGTGSSTSLTSLLAGSHTLRVWYGSDRRERVAVVGDLAETDVVRNGTNAWIWSSSANTAEHLLLPAEAPSSSRGKSAAMESKLTVRWDGTPLQTAQRALAMLGKSTKVSVDGTVRVAGRSAYELVLAPKASGSLISRVDIDVDAATSSPLKVQVFTRGTSSPAFSTAFTTLTVGAPDASVFAFSPPPGAKVTTKDLRNVGADAKRGKASEKHAESGPTSTTTVEPTVTGTAWTSVVKVSGVGAEAQALGSSADRTGGSTGAELQTILRSATPVSGAFGRGQLLQTRLLTVLLLDNGTVYAGAVVPSVLEAAAAK